MAYFRYSVISFFFLMSLSAFAQTPFPGHAASLADGTGGALLNQPNSVFVSGNLAFITSAGSSGGALEIVDITDPTAPAHKGSYALTDVTSVMVVGTNAYITCGGTTNSLVILDISNPATPAFQGSLTNDVTNGVLLQNPVSVFVSGNYAYVASAGSNALEIVDVTSPTNPTHYSSIVDGTALLNSPNAVFVSGTNAFVASYGSNALEIIDVSNPLTPAHLASVVDNGSGSLSNPTAVSVAGNFAFVTSQAGNTLEVINVTDPSNPIVAGGITDGTNGALIGSPQSLFIAGNYCYIASKGSNALEIIDISNASVPAHAAKLANGTNGALLNSPQSVFVSGNYAYVVGGSNALEVVSVFSPVVPQATAASSLGQNQFQANWNSVGNASGYLVDVSTDNFSSFVYNGLSSTGHSLLITGLSTNTTYQYRVRSTNTNGSSANSSTISVLTITDTPVATTATSPTTTGFTANWNSVNGASSYEIDVATDLNFTSIVSGYNNLAVATNSLVINGLSSGVTYYYQVRSVNASGSSSSSNAISQITIPANPVATSASSIAQTTFTANWNAVTGASGYVVDVATDAGFSALLGSYTNVSVATNSLSVTGLTASTTYYYRVKATNAGGTSGSTSFISVLTLPATPTALAATPVNQTSFTANWSAVSGATSYQIDVSANSSFSSLLSGYNNLSVATTSVSVNGLTAGITYYYKVRSVNATGSSPSSNTISQITAPPNPTASPASNISETSFTANWQSATGASNYFLDVATDVSFNNILPNYNSVSVASTSSSVNGLTAGTTYYYRIRANNAGGSSSYSGTITMNTIPAAPAATAATLVSVSGFTANWNTTTGATGYFLDVAADASFTSPLSGYINRSVGNVTSYAVASALSPATTYYYRVRATGPGGTSVNSNVISLLTPPAVPTATQATSIAQTGFTANWNSVAGASSYSIDVATDAAFSSKVAGYSNLSVATTSTTVTGLSSGVTYYYRVSSVNSGGSSSYSNSISLITIPSNPAASNATAISTNSFTANWATATGATNYFLDVATDNSFNSILGSYTNLSVSGTSTVVSGLSSGNTYYYRVRAANAGGTSFNSSVITVITIPSAPVALAATAVNLNSFVANWSSVIGASFYTIDVAADNAFTNLVYSNINVGNAFSYNAASLTTGTTYYYRVRANNASGNSIYSNTISTTTLNVVTVQSSALTFSNISPNSITASFTSGNGASRIVVVSAGSALSGLPSNGITYNANASFGSGNTLGNGYVVYNGSSNTVAVTGLSAATIYYFQVFEYNGTGGTENYLTTASTNNPASASTVSTVPTAQPGAIIFSQQTATSVTVSFQAASAAPAGYIALRAAGSSPTTAPASGTSYAAGVVIGNATVAYVGNGTTFNETSLPTNTQYFYSIYSYNGSNSNISYLTTQPAQGNVTLDIVPPVITFPNANPTSVNDGSTLTLSLNATDNFTVATVQLFHRGITESAFTSSLATAGSGGNYSIQTPTSWYDALGMEYYFIATDENGNATTKPAASFFIKKVEPTLTYQIPASTGNGVNDYKIFSFPYNLSPSNSVDAVFPSVASTDLSKFRMLWYNPTKKAYDEYAKGEFTKVDLSKGYWLLTSNETSATATNATLPTFDRSHLDSIKLLPGWNQIGNPYPTAIRWSDVQNFAGQPAGTDTLSLFVYNSGWSKLKSTETLPPFSGGFVKNATSAPITIYIPFLGQSTLGGRTTNDNAGSDISQASWQVDLSFVQNGTNNQIGGIGMDPKAHYALDRFDDSNPPGFHGMPELLFEQKEIAITDLARSVVPTQQNYSWKFLATGVIGQPAELNWNADLGHGSEQLFLLDETTMQVIDMRAQQTYSFALTERHSFKLFFGNDVKVTTDEVQLSPPFPNPAIEKKTNFVVGLPDSNTDYSVNLRLYNPSGELIDADTKNLSGGIHQLQWSMTEGLIPGMYFYRLSVSDGKRNVSSTGKISIP